MGSGRRGGRPGQAGAPHTATPPGKRGRVTGVSNVAADGLLGLLHPVWQALIAVCLLVVTVLGLRRLAARGPARMTNALFVTGFLIVAHHGRRDARGQLRKPVRPDRPDPRPAQIDQRNWGPAGQSRRLARLGTSWRIWVTRSRSRSATARPTRVRRLRHHGPPRVDHHAPPEAAPARVVVADLAGRDHVALVLDRPGPQQHLPVVATGVGGEGRRHQQHAGAGDGQLPVQLGEAQVVADRQADRDALDGTVTSSDPRATVRDSW